MDRIRETSQKWIYGFPLTIAFRCENRVALRAIISSSARKNALKCTCMHICAHNRCIWYIDDIYTYSPNSPYVHMWTWDVQINHRAICIKTAHEMHIKPTPKFTCMRKKEKNKEEEEFNQIFIGMESSHFLKKKVSFYQIQSFSSFFQSQYVCPVK